MANQPTELPNISTITLESSSHQTGPSNIANRTTKLPGISSTTTTTTTTTKTQSLQCDMIARILDYENNSKDGSKSQNMIFDINNILLPVYILVKSAVWKDGFNGSEINKKFGTERLGALSYQEWQQKVYGRNETVASLAQEVALLCSDDCCHDGEIKLHANLNEMKERLVVAKNSKFEQVNTIVKERTNNAIDPMVTAADCRSKKATIISQSMLKGKWTNPFSFFKQGSFHKTCSNKVSTKYYQTISYSKMCILKTDKFEAVAIPLADDVTSPLVVMIKPVELNQKPNITTEELYKRVLAASGNDSLGDMLTRILCEGQSPETHYIRTPMFRFKSDLNLVKILSWNKEGSCSDFAELFLSEYALFKDVDAINPLILGMFSRNSIDFNKDGIVARSSALVCMTDGAPPEKPDYPVVVFNQPFMLCTVDRRQLAAATNIENELVNVAMVTNPATATTDIANSQLTPLQNKSRSPSSPIPIPSQLKPLQNNSRCSSSPIPFPSPPQPENETTYSDYSNDDYSDDDYSDDYYSVGGDNYYLCEPDFD